MSGYNMVHIRALYGYEPDKYRLSRRLNFRRKNKIKVNSKKKINIKKPNPEETSQHSESSKKNEIFSNSSSYIDQSDNEYSDYDIDILLEREEDFFINIERNILKTCFKKWMRKWEFKMIMAIRKNMNSKEHKDRKIENRNYKEVMLDKSYSDEEEFIFYSDSTDDEGLYSPGKDRDVSSRIIYLDEFRGIRAVGFEDSFHTIE